MAPVLLTIFEFVTAIGFVIVFYCLFRELKKVLASHKYMKIKYRTATYLSLISILAISRFFYYGVISLTYRLVEMKSSMLKCEDLVPSYLTEIFFCLFVIFHVFVEGKSKETEKVRNTSQIRQASQNEVHSLSEGLTGVTNSVH